MKEEATTATHQHEDACEAQDALLIPNLLLKDGQAAIGLLISFALSPEQQEELERMENDPEMTGADAMQHMLSMLHDPATQLDILRTHCSSLRTREGMTSTEEERGREFNRNLIKAVAEMMGSVDELESLLRLLSQSENRG